MVRYWVGFVSFICLNMMIAYVAIKSGASLEAAEVGITVFGPAAFLLVLLDNKRHQLWGCYMGWCSNPFWWAMVIITQQWITIPVHCLYTWGWYNKMVKLLEGKSWTK